MPIIEECPTAIKTADQMSHTKKNVNNNHMQIESSKMSNIAIKNKTQSSIKARLETRGSRSDKNLFNNQHHYQFC